eukprot:5689383-Amphidinium_carterae.1
MLHLSVAISAHSFLEQRQILPRPSACSARSHTRHSLLTGAPSAQYSVLAMKVERDVSLSGQEKCICDSSKSVCLGEWNVHNLMTSTLPTQSLFAWFGVTLTLSMSDLSAGCRSLASCLEQYSSRKPKSQEGWQLRLHRRFLS